MCGFQMAPAIFNGLASVRVMLMMHIEIVHRKTTHAVCKMNDNILIHRFDIPRFRSRSVCVCVCVFPHPQTKITTQ